MAHEHACKCPVTTSNKENVESSLPNQSRHRVGRPETQFVSWISNQAMMQSADGVSIYSQLDLDEDARTMTTPSRPTCLLDYLYDWLVFGDGFEHVRTYQDWLLVVVSIMDQVHRGVLCSVFESTDWTLEELARGGERRYSWQFDLREAPFLERPLDQAHPALSKRHFKKMRTIHLKKEEKVPSMPEE